MTHAARQSLEDLLNREITIAQLLSATLAAERAALTGNSPEAVKERAADKVRLFGDIEELELERTSLWSAAGAEIGSLATDRWRMLMEIMARCRAANEVNGHIIQIRQNQIRQLFDIVRGGAPTTYGPQGKTFAKALRALAKA